MKAAQIPNLLTTVRILLVPWILVCLAAGAYRRALVLLVIASLSDLLDGYLARRFGWQSRLGGLLDPLADKLLVNACFLGLWVGGHLPGWLPLLVLARDLVIIGGALAYHWRIGPLQPEPSWAGKLCTLVQTAFLWLAVFDLALDRSSSPWWPYGVTVLLVALLLSGADYVRCWSRRALDSTVRERKP